jgi:HD-GYP domain-containing protein (c-di-GMP phosphodiesterase class II)
VVRKIPLLVAVGDELVSGLAMEMLRVATGSEAVTVNTGKRGIESVEIAELTVPTQPAGNIWLHFAEARSTAGRYVSAARVLSGEVDPEQLNGKLVLLGLTGFGLNDMRTTALGELVPGIEIQAQLLETMFDGRFIVRPWWMKWVEIGGILALGLFLVWFIPRTDSPLAKFLQTVPRAYLWLTLGINLVLAGIGFLLFRNLGLLFDTASAFLILSAIIGSLVSSALIQIDRANKAREELQQELRETAKLVAGGMAATFAIDAEAANTGPTGQPEDELTRALAAEAARLPQLAGQLDAQMVELISRAALHRDMGMVQVPREYLDSPEPLPADARRRLHQHTEVGRLALSSVRELLEREHRGIPASLERYLEVLRDTVDSHHERWDGHGYPQGLAGDAIPLAGRIVAIVDTYQSLVSERPYRPAHTHSEALQIIEQGSGSQFDPQLVPCLLKVLAAR